MLRRTCRQRLESAMIPRARPAPPLRTRAARSNRAGAAGARRRRARRAAGVAACAQRAVVLQRACELLPATKISVELAANIHQAA